MFHRILCSALVLVLKKTSVQLEHVKTPFPQPFVVKLNSFVSDNNRAKSGGRVTVVI
jgi:hypothetical protein